MYVAEEHVEMIAQIEEAIEALKAEKKEIYAALGEQYFASADAEAVPAELAEIYAAVVAKNEEIEVKLAELKAEQGITECANCGKEIAIDAMFCKYCGCSAAVIDTEAVSDQCPYCGCEIEEDQKFCTRCGNSLKGAKILPKEEAIAAAPVEEVVEEIVEEPVVEEIIEEVVEEPAVEEVVEEVIEEPVVEEVIEEVMPTEAPAEEATPKLFCTNCGAKLDGVQRFCIICGQRVE